MSNDGLFVRGEWTYRGDLWSFGATAEFGSRDYDAPNPVYDRRLDTDFFALGLQAFYRLPVASNRWSLNAGIVYAEDDSDVNFHDTELVVLNFGALYRFGMLPRRAQ